MAQVGKDKNNIFCLYNSSNRNWKYLADFSLKNRLEYLYTKFQKSEEKLWSTLTQITQKDC